MNLFSSTRLNIGRPSTHSGTRAEIVAGETVTMAHSHGELEAVDSTHDTIDGAS